MRYDFGELLWQNLANCVAVGAFTDIEEFEAIGALASKIREAIRHDKLGFGARNGYEEDA